MKVSLFRSVVRVLLCVGLSMAVGCQQANRPATADGESAHSHGDEHSHEAAHDHAAEGPHHGDLVELGDEEYHAEVVHSDSRVTVYVLDRTAKSAVAIDAKEITINVAHDGNAEQFKLLGSPDSGDAEGKTSRFELNDAELAEDIVREGATVKLAMMIDGKMYSAPLVHHHEDHADHEGHDHDHADGQHDHSDSEADGHGHDHDHGDHEVQAEATTANEGK